MKNDIKTLRENPKDGALKLEIGKAARATRRRARADALNFTALKGRSINHNNNNNLLIMIRIMC